MAKSDKFYRRAYDQYVTSTSGSYHRLDSIGSEYRNACYVWKPHLESHLSRYSRKNARVLDLGCGLGHQMYFFKNIGFRNVGGIDLSAENVAFVKKQGLDARKADIRVFLKNKKSSYDIISLFDVIEHFTREEAIGVLKLIKDSLKPGGVLIMQTLNGSHPFFGKNYYWDITHEAGYTTQSLGELLQLAGWRQNTIFTINSFHTYHPNPLVSMARRAVFGTLAAAVESAYKLLARAQGVVLTECKPTLISLSFRVKA